MTLFLEDCGSGVYISDHIVFHSLQFLFIIVISLCPEKSVAATNTHLPFSPPNSLIPFRMICSFAHQIVHLLPGIQTSHPTGGHRPLLSAAGVHTRDEAVSPGGVCARLLRRAASAQHPPAQRARTAAPLQLQSCRSVHS